VAGNGGASVASSRYKDWKAKYGDAAWDQLEAVSGKLA
jgi:hypothetical protein